MTTLNLKCTPPNRRPRLLTDLMRRAAAEQITDRLIHRQIATAKERDQIIEELLGVTRCYDTKDGYQIARELEIKHYWECDMEIAEILNDFPLQCEKELADSQRRWADDNPMQRQFADDTAVMYKGQPATVIGVYEHKPYCYKLKTNDCPNRAYIIAYFEDVTEVD